MYFPLSSMQIAAIAPWFSWRDKPPSTMTFTLPRIEAFHFLFPVCITFYALSLDDGLLDAISTSCKYLLTKHNVEIRLGTVDRECPCALWKFRDGKPRGEVNRFLQIFFVSFASLGFAEYKVSLMQTMWGNLYDETRYSSTKAITQVNNTSKEIG
jgi:hypothetical protein